MPEIVDEGAGAASAVEEARAAVPPTGRLLAPHARGALGHHGGAQGGALDQERIDAEDVLLGLLASRGLAVAVLSSLGVTEEAVRGRARRGPGSPEAELPFGPETKKLPRGARARARPPRHRAPAARAADSELLHELGVDAERVRAEIRRRLAA